jgi:hypothetical protein
MTRRNAVRCGGMRSLLGRNHNAYSREIEADHAEIYRTGEMVLRR